MNHNADTDAEKSDKTSVWKPLCWKDVEPAKIQLITEVIEKLPDLPVHVHKILKIVSDIDSDAKEITQLASSDPVLITRILNAVNSSYYGFSKKVDDLQLAIVLLGFAEIRTLAIQSSLSGRFEMGHIDNMYDTRTLWSHSYQVSVSTEAFLSEKNFKMAGVFLSLGLLHDIGKFILLNIAMAMKKKGIKTDTLEGMRPGACLLEKEERLFGINHAIAGGMIARKWGLSERITTVAEYHHSPSYFDMDDIPHEYLKDVTIICMADLVANSLEERNDLPPEPQEAFFELLGYTPPIENIITDNYRRKIEKAKRFLTYIE